MHEAAPETAPSPRWLRAGVALAAAVLAAVVTTGSAAAAAHPGYRTPGYRGTTKAVVTAPAVLPTPVTLSPSGRMLDVMVDAAGTSHIVWVTGDGVGADAVHYCRLPRAASACTSTQVLVPQKAYGDGDDPAFNSSAGARVVQIGQQVVILDYRYPTDYPKPDGSTGSNTVLEWVSEDGGASFTGPGLIGSQPISGGVVKFGSDNDPRILTTTDGVTGGTYVQTLTPGQFTSESGNLASGDVNEAYSGSLALDGGLPVAAFGGLANQTLVRRWTGRGSSSDPATWGPASVLAGSEPQLAGGPSGLFLMNRPQGNGPYAVRRLTPTGAGAPATISDVADPEYRDFAQTSSGGLVAGWESRGGDTPGVSVRAASDAGTWSPPQRLIAGADNGQLRVAAAGDGGGIAVLNHTGGINQPGEIVAIAYGQRTPTGVPGIAGIPGGGDPKATTACQEVGFGAVKITGQAGCFLHGTGSFVKDVVSDGELNLNGLRIVPDPGVQVIIDAHAHTLDTTGDVSVIASGEGMSVTLWHGQVHVHLPTAGAETDLFNFDMSQFAADLDGFPIDAKIDVKLTADGVRIPVDLKLPAVFGGVDAHAEMLVDARQGLHVGALAMAIHNAPIGPLLADFAINYNAKDTAWEGSGKLTFPAGLVLAADVSFARGHFLHGGIEIKPPGYGLPLFTDVYLDDIKGDLELEPKTVITAGVGIGVIPIGTPASFANTMQIDGDLALTLDNPFRIEVTGHASLLGIPFEQARLLFVSDGYLSLDGQFDFRFDPIEISAGINAVVDLPHKLFSAEFKADFFVLGYDLSSVDGIISSDGMAVCGDLPFFPFTRITVGHHWNHDFTDLLPSFDFFRAKACDLSGYRVKAGAGRAGAAGAGLPIALPHADTVNVAVHGAGAAPVVALTAPDGKQIVPAVTAMAGAATALAAPGGPAAAAFTVPSDKTTIVVLRKPAAGTWTVTAQPGSAALSAVAESHTVAPASVHATVAGHGRRLAVRYRLRPRPGMTVRLAEQAGRVLHVVGQAHGSGGTLPFVPADGPAGSRSLVALVEQDGLPRPRIVLAHFRAPGPLRPARVAGLRAAIRGTTLKVTFGRAPDARRYQVRISSTDGKQRLLVLPGTARSARVADMGPGAVVTVTVRGVAGNGRTGRGSVVRTPKPH